MRFFIVMMSCFALSAGTALANESAEQAETSAEAAGETKTAESDAATAKPAATESKADSEAKKQETKKEETEASEEGSAATTEPTAAAEPATEAAGSEQPAKAASETTASEPPAEPSTEAVSEPTATSAEPTATAEPGVQATVEQAPADVGIERSGIYFGLGLGAGAGTLSDETLAGPSAGLLHIRMGLSISSQLAVGGSVALLGQWNTWTAQEHAGSAMSSVLVDATYFPIASLPWSITAGAGWGSAMVVDRLADKRKDSPRVLAESGNGVSFVGATGWDFFAGPGANLGLQLRYDGASLGDMGLVSTGTLNVWLTWY